MNTHFSRGMAKATELTRSGNLTEATEVIRSLLQRPKPNAVKTRADETGDAIDGDFTRLESDNSVPDAAPPKRGHAGRQSGSPRTALP